MKKFLLSAAMIMAVVLGVNAQGFEQGDMTLGGMVNLGASLNKNNNSFTYGLRPEFNYYVADHLAVGVCGEIFRTGNKVKDSEEKLKSRELSFALCPQVSYELSLGERWGFSNTLSLNVEWSKGKSIVGNDVHKGDLTNAVSLYYYPGVYCFMNDNWFFDLGAGVLGYDFNADTFNIGIYDIYIGLHYRF